MGLGPVLVPVSDVLEGDPDNQTNYNQWECEERGGEIERAGESERIRVPVSVTEASAGPPAGTKGRAS